MRLDRPAPLVVALLTGVAPGPADAPRATTLRIPPFGLIGLARGHAPRVDIVNALPPRAEGCACGVRAIA